MAEEKAGTAKIPKTAEETRVMDDEELTRIVGGTGAGSNDDDSSDPNRDGDDDPSTDTNDQGDTGVFTSPGPDW